MRSRSEGTYAYFVLAFTITWVSALPAAVAWMHHAAPSPYAVGLAGLSAFGPLLAVLLVAERGRRGEAFGRWRTNPVWVLIAIAVPIAVRVLASLLDVALGGHASLFYPPDAPEQIAALVVFPLGEEFGWRGFAHPRMVERYGMVRGPLFLGVLWGLWHLVYSITPQAAGFDAFAFGYGMVELPLYSLVLAYVFERSNRSMAVAIAFHAGAHLDHLERVPQTEWGLHALHMAVLAVAAFFAARALRAMSTNEDRAKAFSAVAVG